ncbi:hypothetical protein QEV83_03595 [Methylocapsa sp. D3K7]|uniref:hypothetical protein n=1 Tax=Methylocapsa sp. D3K7 TaxID=3041435 RepID=UPI00244EC787|nr:hypothetical protein [Methylocapsa sp. D3K7]WGJ15379.1 hypothetical protein QEV83_03595 [Methylocapsa sp. D3K7]
MRLWRSNPQLLDGFASTGTSSDPEDVKARLPTWLRAELRTQLQGKVISGGDPVTQEQADDFIDEAISCGMLDSEGTLTFRVKGSREQIIAQILEVCELWNEPMTKARAEAMAISAIKASRGWRASAWLSKAILILAIILAVLFIAGIITAEAGPFHLPVT